MAQFGGGRSEQQAERDQERRQLLNKPRQLGAHGKAILSAGVPAVGYVLEKQSEKSYGRHEEHHVGHQVEEAHLLGFGDEQTVQQAHHVTRRMTSEVKQMQVQLWTQHTVHVSDQIL